MKEAKTFFNGDEEILVRKVNTSEGNPAITITTPNAKGKIVEYRNNSDGLTSRDGDFSLIDADLASYLIALAPF